MRLIQKGSTDYLRTIPRIRDVEMRDLAHPSAGTARVVTPALDSGVAACTVDDTSVTVMTGAEGAAAITLAASTAFVRGTRYLIVWDSAERLVVRSARTQTGTSQKLMSPLPFDVAGGQLIGIELIRQLTVLETATEGRGLIHWTATIAGVAYAWTEEFEIVRRVPTWMLDDDELLRRFPEVLARRDASDVSLQETREAALEEELLPRLMAGGILPQNIISTWELVPAHVAAVRLFLSRDARDVSLEQRDEYRRDLEEKISLALKNPRGWYDAPQETDPSPGTDDGGRFGVLGYSR